MPAVAAATIPFWAAAVPAAASATSSIIGANKRANATQKAAETTTNAANYAADRQLEGSREVLAYQQALAQNAYANAEAARRGNYDQWAARERRLGSFGEMLGYGQRSIPEYVPGVAPEFGQTASGPVWGGPMDGGRGQLVPVGSGQTAAAAGMSPRAGGPQVPGQMTRNGGIIWWDPSQPIELMDTATGQVIRRFPPAQQPPVFQRRSVDDYLQPRKVTSPTPGSFGSYLAR